MLVIDQDEDRTEPIEIIFRVNPTLRVAGICLNIANCPKCEIFTGNSLEYHSVQSGTKQDDMPELDVYKFDINFAKRPSPVISLQVSKVSNNNRDAINKFLCSLFQFKPTTADVLIFGIDVFVCPAEGSSRAGIDLQNVEDMLSQTQLSEAAERCKEFLKVSLSSTSKEAMNPLNLSDSNIPVALELFERKLADMEGRLMSHIDLRMKALEESQEKHFRMIMERIDANSNNNFPTPTYSTFESTLK